MTLYLLIWKDGDALRFRIYDAKRSLKLGYEQLFGRMQDVEMREVALADLASVLYNLNANARNPDRDEIPF